MNRVFSGLCRGTFSELLPGIWPPRPQQHTVAVGVSGGDSLGIEIASFAPGNLRLRAKRKTPGRCGAHGGRDREESTSGDGGHRFGGLELTFSTFSQPGSFSTWLFFVLCRTQSLSNLKRTASTVSIE